MNPVCAGGGTGPAADAQALEDVLQVVLHREKAALKDDRDLGVGLAFGDPMQHVGLTWCQIQLSAQELGRGVQMSIFYALWQKRL